MWNCLYSIHLEFTSGKNLFQLEERCEQYAVHMDQVRQNEALLLTASIWRLISNLIGKDSPLLSSRGLSLEPSTTIADSQIFHEEILLRDIRKSSPVLPFFDRVAQNMLLAYKRKYVEGAEMSIKRGGEFLGNFPFQAIAVWDTFLRGVCLFGAARQTKKRRYKRHARKIRATVDKWLEQDNPNVRHHSALFAAEDLALRGKFKEAQRSYESAIVAASRGGYIQDRAIAHERYALHLLQDMKDSESASYHVKEADRMFKEWGAHSLCYREAPTSVQLELISRALSQLK